jgi:hypothetical protein
MNFKTINDRIIFLTITYATLLLGMCIIKADLYTLILGVLSTVMIIWSVSVIGVRLIKKSREKKNECKATL